MDKALDDFAGFGYLLDSQVEDTDDAAPSRAPRRAARRAPRRPARSLAALGFARAFFSSSIQAGVLHDLMEALGASPADPRGGQAASTPWGASPTHATSFPPGRRPPARLPAAWAGINLTARLIPTPIL